MGLQKITKFPHRMLDGKKKPKVGGTPKQEPPRTPKKAHALREALDGRAAAESGKHTMADWPHEGE